MSDIELAALAALLTAETMEREAANRQRESQGYAPAYDDSVAWPARESLRGELQRRGIDA